MFTSTILFLLKSNFLFARAQVANSVLTIIFNGITTATMRIEPKYSTMLTSLNVLAYMDARKHLGSVHTLYYAIQISIMQLSGKVSYK